MPGVRVRTSRSGTIDTLHRLCAGRRSLALNLDDVPTYSDDELEFLKAISFYKTRYCRPHPTWSEVLQIAKALGYRKEPAG